MLKKNLAASFLGKAWAGLINLACVPIYIKFIGVEAYGLVGFFSSLQAMLSIMDMGLSVSVSRELARYSIDPSKRQSMRDMTRTLELLYWSVCAAIGVAIAAAAPFLVHRVLHSRALPASTATQVMILSGLTLAVQWPLSFYTGALLGLQKQVLYNVCNAGLWTFRSVGALLVVLLAPDPILSFFIWQLVAGALASVAMALCLWQVLPPTSARARFDGALLRSVWQFAAGMGAVYVVVLLFNQADKLFLSTRANLETFGHYTLAWQIVGSLYLLYYPVYTTFFPLFSQLVAAADHARLAAAYHKSCQLVSVSVLPLSAIIAFFARDVLFLWTRNATLADHAAAYLAILMVGAVCSALLYMPFSIQQANGLARYGIRVFLPFLVLLVPALFLGFRWFGSVGVASAWASLNALQSAVAIWATHRRFLPQEQGAWLVSDVGRPLLATALVAGGARLAIGEPLRGLSGCLAIAGLFLVSFLAAAGSAPTTQAILWRAVRQVTRFVVPLPRP